MVSACECWTFTWHLRDLAVGFCLIFKPLFFQDSSLGEPLNLRASFEHSYDADVFVSLYLLVVQLLIPKVSPDPEMS